MGMRTIVGLGAVVGAMGFAGVACGQPEYLRLDPRGNQFAAPWIDVDGDLMAWTETPGPPHTGMTTHVYRRTGEGWAPEAELRSSGRYQELGALTAVDGDRVVMRAGGNGLRIWRHGDNGWIEEHIDYGSNDYHQFGEAFAIDGDWLAIPLGDWDQWDRPLVQLFRFDGDVWRIDATLDVPRDPRDLPLWIAIEDDLMAVQLRRQREYWEPGPVVLFRLRAGAWSHEATLPTESWWVAINEKRVAVVDYDGLSIYIQSTPGVWEVDSLVPEVEGQFVLDGDTLVTTEGDVPAEWYYRRRAAIFRSTDAGWVRTRAMYPSNTYTLGTHWRLPYALSQFGPIGWSHGEVFAITAERSETAWWDPWRIVVFPACRADFNGDGAADMADLLAFLEGREQGMMSADYDMDIQIGRPGEWDEGDFLEFMRALEEGC